MRHCTEYELSAFQVRISEENKLNATTQHFIDSGVTKGARGTSAPRRSTLGAPNWGRNVTCLLRNVRCQRMLTTTIYKMYNYNLCRMSMQNLIKITKGRKASNYEP